MIFCHPGMAETQKTANESGGSLLIPGGLALLANTVGLDAAGSDCLSCHFV